MVLPPGFTQFNGTAPAYNPMKVPDYAEFLRMKGADTSGLSPQDLQRRAQNDDEYTEYVRSISPQSVMAGNTQYSPIPGYDGTQQGINDYLRMYSQYGLKPDEIIFDANGNPYSDASRQKYIYSQVQPNDFHKWFDTGPNYVAAAATMGIGGSLAGAAGTGVGTGATGLAEGGALASETGFVPGSFEIGASGYGGSAATGLDAAAGGAGVADAAWGVNPRGVGVDDFADYWDVGNSGLDQTAAFRDPFDLQYDPSITNSQGLNPSAYGSNPTSTNWLDQLKQLISGNNTPPGTSSILKRIFSGNNSGGSPLEQLYRSLYGGNQGMGGIGDLLAGIYGLSQAGKLNNLAAPSQAAAEQLKYLTNNPDAIMSLPGYQSLLKAREQGLSRRLAAQGYNASGNEKAALEDLGGAQYMEFRNTELDRLSRMAMGGVAPQTANLQLQGNSINRILYGGSNLVGSF